MRMIDLTREGQLHLRHFDLMMSYERFMPEKASIKAQEEQSTQKRSPTTSLRINIKKDPYMMLEG